MMQATKLLLAIVCSTLSFISHAQFAPQAGLAGSTAMHKDSIAFVDWASNCTVKRGWIDIADTSLGHVSAGDHINGIGKADGNIVSLGDAGEAIFFFENPIVNGAGFDFAVFENGFSDPIDSNGAYIELAQVEVSNDGFTYYSFASVCENDTSIQIAGAGEYMDARKLNNLAGKYIAGYGTPFDLDELSFILGLDIDNIRFVKIKDVVGSINDEDCMRDFNQHKINDPYPTPFPTGGFDLDALGIIHQKYPTGMLNVDKENDIIFYPNPCSDIVRFTSPQKIVRISVYSFDGKKVACKDDLDEGSINISSLAKGAYMVTALLKNGTHVNQYISKNE